MSFKMFMLYFIASLINCISILYAYKKINKIEKIELNYKSFLIIISICLLIVFNNYFNLKQLRLICSMILTATLIKTIFNKKIKNVFVDSIIITFLSIILEIILSGGLILFTENIKTFNNNIYFKFIFSLFNSIIFIILISRIKIINIIIKIKTIKYNKLMSYYLYLTILIIITATLIYRGEFLNNKDNFIFSMLTIINFTIMVLLILKEHSNNDELNKINRELINSFKAYNETIDECRELKHNLKNDLIYLKSYLNTSDKKIVDELIKKYNKEYDWINKINEMPIGIQGLIFLKIREAEKKNIKIIVTSEKNIPNTFNSLDLCNSIGIIIDNAIEASIDSKSQNIIINISNTNKYIEVEVINKFSNNIDLEKITSKNYSTKKRNSGIGLAYIEKLKHIKVNYKIQNDLFISKLTYEVK